MENKKETINVEDFFKIEMRIGTVVEAYNSDAKKPSLKLIIDFGPIIGKKKSSAQITHHYTIESIIGKKVICVVNLPPKQIGKFMSEGKLFFSAFTELLKSIHTGIRRRRRKNSYCNCRWSSPKWKHITLISYRFICSK